MSDNLLPVSAHSDVEAWDLYKNTEYRWTFNKLEVALRQGLSAGPAATAPDSSGWYIHRPIYNLFGLGVGAKKFFYQSFDREKLINYATVPPGHFWCEWIDDSHISANYRKDVFGKWHLVSVWEGVHSSDENLTRFEYWEKVKKEKAIQVEDLPDFVSWLSEPNITCFNLEIRNKYVIEIHLRSGDEVFDEYEVGDRLVPIWSDEENNYKNFIPEPDSHLAKYKAYGNLSVVRNGFIVVKKSETDN
jgi:hypothetical protein